MCGTARSPVTSGSRRRRNSRPADQFRTRPFMALAKELQVMRPCASAGSFARNRVFTVSASSRDSASTVRRTDPAAVLAAQKSSKFVKVRCTAIFRISTPSSPALTHSSRRASMREASALGGPTVSFPSARTSEESAPSGIPRPTCPRHKRRRRHPDGPHGPSRQRPLPVPARRK